MEASPGDALGNIDSPPVHYDGDEQGDGYDDLLSESDVRVLIKSFLAKKKKRKSILSIDKIFASFFLLLLSL